MYTDTSPVFAVGFSWRGERSSSSNPHQMASATKLLEVYPL